MAGKPDDDNGVSGLPEDWGRIVIPDDVSQLSELVAQVRQELRYEQRVVRRERRMPFIVLAVTVVITLASLFTVPWLAGSGGGDPGRVTSPAPQTSPYQPSVEPSESDGCDGEDCPSESQAGTGGR